MAHTLTKYTPEGLQLKVIALLQQRPLCFHELVRLAGLTDPDDSISDNALDSMQDALTALMLKNQIKVDSKPITTKTRYRI